MLYNDLVAARIRRSNPSIDGKTARDDASALRHVIACVQQAAAIRPDDFPAEDGDLAAIIVRTALGLWAEDEAENSHMCGLVESQLLVAAELLGIGAFDLYDAYIDVRIHVDNIDAEGTGLEDLLEPADDKTRWFLQLMGAQPRPARPAHDPLYRPWPERRPGSKPVTGAEKGAMPNVALGIPADLTAARFRRANPSISEGTAREDAAHVQDIIARVREAYAISPTHPGWCGGEDETVEAILRTVGGVSPKDHNDACNECDWVMDLLTYTEQLTGERDLYRKWLRVCGHVKNEDYSWVFEDERPSNDPSVEGVTFEEEVVFEDDKDGDRTRRLHRPHLHLVTGPEPTSEEDMRRRFLALMGDSS